MPLPPDMDAARFIREQTVLARPPLVPEIALHLATEITPLWQATEDRLAENGIEPPFWAFAWPGSQLLARYVLDGPGRVRGKRVLDFASGSGLAAIACAMAGADHVVGNDIDPMAVEAALLNASVNGVAIEGRTDDLVGTDGPWDLILCGDICYNAPMAGRIFPWLRAQATRAEVWLADPGRTYCPTEGLAPLISRAVPTLATLEDRAERQTTIFRVLAG